MVNNEQDPKKQLIEFLKDKEGFSPGEYKDPSTRVDQNNIGYGMRSDWSGWDRLGLRGRDITPEEGELALNEYINTDVIPELKRVHPNYDSLPENVKIGLQQLMFQKGLGDSKGGYRASPRFIDFINQGNFEEAAKEMERGAGGVGQSQYFGQHPDRARWSQELIGRRDPLAGVPKEMLERKLPKVQGLSRPSIEPPRPSSGPVESTRMEVTSEGEEVEAKPPTGSVMDGEIKPGGQLLLNPTSPNPIPFEPQFDQATPNGLLEELTTRKDFTDRISERGTFIGLDSYLQHTMELEASLYSSLDKEFDLEMETGRVAAQLYQDAMFKIGVSVGHLDIEDPAFQEYAMSAEGVEETESAITRFNLIKRYGGDAANIPQNIWEILPEIKGFGYRDPDKYGLTEAQYNSLPVSKRIGYSTFVAFSEAGRHLAAVVGYKPKQRLQAQAAPWGQMAGFAGAFLVPYAGAKKVLQGTKLISRLRPYQAEMLYGAIGDVIITQKEDSNISRMLVDNFEHPAFDNWFTEFLAVEDDDSVIVAKLKAIPEGMILDRAVAGLLLGLKGTKKLGVGTAKFLGERGVKAFQALREMRPITLKGRMFKALRESEEILREADTKLGESIGAELPAKIRELATHIPDVKPITTEDIVNSANRVLLDEPFLRGIVTDKEYGRVITRARVQKIMAYVYRLAGEEDLELFASILRMSESVRSARRSRTRTKVPIEDLTAEIEERVLRKAEGLSPKHLASLKEELSTEEGKRIILDVILKPGDLSKNRLDDIISNIPSRTYRDIRTEFFNEHGRFPTGDEWKGISDFLESVEHSINKELEADVLRLKSRRRQRGSTFGEGSEYNDRGDRELYDHILKLKKSIGVENLSDTIRKDFKKQLEIAEREAERRGLDFDKITGEIEAERTSLRLDEEPHLGDTFDEGLPEDAPLRLGADPHLIRRPKLVQQRLPGFPAGEGGGRPQKPSVGPNEKMPSEYKGHFDGSKWVYPKDAENFVVTARAALGQADDVSIEEMDELVKQAKNVKEKSFVGEKEAAEINDVVKELKVVLKAKKRREFLVASRARFEAMSDSELRTTIFINREEGFEQLGGVFKRIGREELEIAKKVASKRPGFMLENLKDALRRFRNNPLDIRAKSDLEWAYYKFSFTHAQDPAAIKTKLIKSINAPPGIKLDKEGFEETVREAGSVEYKEWSRRNKLSGRATAEEIDKRLGSDFLDATLDSAKSKAARLGGDKKRQVANLITDVYINGLLNSFGVPVAAAAGGVINRIMFDIERLIGSIFVRGGAQQRLGREIGRQGLKAIRRRDPAAIKNSNVLYALTGGNSSDPNSGVWDIIKNLLSLSTPSVVDPHYVAQSEQALGAGLRAGFDKGLGLDPVGLSRLGAAVKGMEDGWSKNALSFLVGFLEFLPRKALGVIDESLKSSVYMREVADRSYDILARHLEIDDAESLRPIIDQIVPLFRYTNQDVDALTDEIIETLSRVNKRRLTSSVVKALVGEAVPTKDLPNLVFRQAKEAPENLRAALREIHETSIQYAREITITQDVPEALEGLIKGAQSSNFVKIGITPFARAATNVVTMGIERVPGLNLILKKERAAISGARGLKEQQRAWGKMVVGATVMSLGAWLNEEDEDTPTLKYTSRRKGTWGDISLKVPVDSSGKLGEAIVNFYEANQEQVDIETERYNNENKTSLTGPEWLKQNLPYESGEGYLELKFDRFAPFGSLLEMGVAGKALFDSTRGKSLKSIDSDPSFKDDFANLADAVMGGGIYNQLGVLGRLSSQPNNQDGIILTWMFDVFSNLVSPTRLTKTPGELFTPTTRPNRSGNFGQKFRASMEGTLLDLFMDEPPKARDFLGRASVRSSRLGFAIGLDYDMDLISHELDFLDMYKRPTPPNEVSYMDGIDLTKYKLRENRSKADNERLKGIVLGDSVNAYEAYQIMTGSQGNSQDGKSAIGDLLKYFKDERYVKLKSRITELANAEDLSEAEEAVLVSELGVEVDIVKRDIDQYLAVGKETAVRTLLSIGDMFVDGSGNTLSSARDKRYEAIKKGNENVLNLLGGNN